MREFDFTSGIEWKDDLKVFEELFRFYYPRLKKYATGFLGNQDEAEDLVQDVFFQLWKEKKVLNKDKNIPSFVFTIVRNRCVNLLKRKVVENKYLASQAAARTEELYHISFEKDEFVPVEELLHRELLKLIAEMPEKCGQVFQLKWIEGKKNREIAELMGISMSMVDKHLARGMGIAKEKLAPGMFLLFVFSKKI